MTPVWKIALGAVGGFSTLTIIMGCLGGMGHTVKVMPDPTESEIYLDGNQVGKGVTELELGGEEGQQYQVKVCGPPGYFCKLTTIDANSPASITVSPGKDNAYFETVDGVDNVNKWIKLPVSKKYSQEEAWQKMTSSITSAISDFEVLDQKSLYLKTAWKVAGKKDDELRARSRIVVAVDNPDPENTVLKVKIESERINPKGEKVEDYPRTFRTYLDALETARARLGN